MANNEQNKELEEVIEYNKELVKKYPFMRLPFHLTGNYDYSYTWLDNMPKGWIKAFGEQMCEEIKNELIKYNYLDKYIIYDIKEKYGRLCWYDSGYPRDSNIDEIIDKYECLSEDICWHCGKPATKISAGYILPWCDKCANDINGDYNRFKFFDIKDIPNKVDANGVTITTT